MSLSLTGPDGLLKQLTKTVLETALITCGHGTSLRRRQARQPEDQPMGTSGYISFIVDGQAINAYSHLDSGPVPLGLTMLHWLRSASAQLEPLKTAIRGLTVVSDDDGRPPTAAHVSRFRQYSDPGVGDPATEWYALLRNTQGRPDAILASGYVVYEDEPWGWIYEVNTDERTFTVNFCNENRVTWPWTDLPPDEQFLAEANQLIPPEEPYDLDAG